MDSPANEREKEQDYEESKYSRMSMMTNKLS
jgi:hypothetical protein